MIWHPKLQNCQIKMLSWLRKYKNWSCKMGSCSKTLWKWKRKMWKLLQRMFAWRWSTCTDLALHIFELDCNPEFFLCFQEVCRRINLEVNKFVPVMIKGSEFLEYIMRESESVTLAQAETSSSTSGNTLIILWILAKIIWSLLISRHVCCCGLWVDFYNRYCEVYWYFPSMVRTLELPREYWKLNGQTLGCSIHKSVYWW